MATGRGRHVQKRYIDHGKIGLAPSVGTSLPHVTNIRCIMHVRWPGEVSPRQRYNTFVTVVVASVYVCLCACLYVCFCVCSHREICPIQHCKPL